MSNNGGRAGGSASQASGSPMDSATGEQQTRSTSVSGPRTQQQPATSCDPPNQRFSSLIHDSEVFLTKLREFKPQSLGCLEARRKSSSTLIFPSPQQACMGPPKCPRYPHEVKPTPGYWIECHGPGVYGPGRSANAAQATGTSTSLTQGAHDGMRQDESSRASMLRSSPFSLSSTGSEHHYLHHQIVSPLGPGATCTPLDDIIYSRPDKELGPSQDEVTKVSDLSTRRRKSIDRMGSSSMIESSIRQLSDCQISPQSIQSANQEQAKPNYSPQAHISTTTDEAKSTHPESSKKVASSIQSRGGIRHSSRRLSKRTMTQDDIDLHKSRRGTPNITITEPSFNQSITIAYQSSKQKSPGLTRQDSHKFEPTRTSPIEVSSASGDDMQPVDRQPPIKFQIHRYMSIGTQQSTDDQQAGVPKTRDFIIERQESSEATEFISSSYETPYRPANHRPSIIREDIDNESCETPVGLGGSTIAPTPHEQREFYCGLSTTEYTKKPYQQSYTEPQNLDQFKDSSLELISFEEENYEKHYYGREHWNYFTNDELLGPVMLSLKQEVNNQRDHFHVLLRTVSYTLHGTIPASTICADRYDREAIVRELSEIAKLKPPLMLGQLPSTPDELLKLDHIFIKTELKVGVIYIKGGQEGSEEAILGNKEESPLFTEFLDLLGDRITLKGFDRYKGGLDTVHNLTGTESIYTMWRNIEIMFHVSTMLPHEENDPQKLQKKRHIGNDIVCVAFIESDDTLFWPGCIKSYFLHTFIAIQTSPKPLKEGERRKYSVSCVCRNEVQYAFKPYLVEQDEFYKSDYFREWLLVKIVNGERASYSAPKFARMQDRTRSQLLEDIITNLANHLVTGQIPKPYRRGSWRPLGHTRASSPLEDSMKDYFEDYDQLAKDFCNAFCGPNKSVLCDVVFRVKDSDGTYKLVHGVRAILAIRSRTFLEMLYGFVPPGTGPTSLQNQTSLRAIEMKALSGESSTGPTSAKEFEQTKNILAKRGSVGTDSSRKTGEKERRQSMLPNLSKSIAQKPNYLTVPNTSGGAGASSGTGTGGLIKNAFNRLVSGNWSGWSGNIKGYKGEPMHIKVDQNKTKVDLNSLAICKEIAKIDADKLTQREFEIKEFDYETFQQTIEYIHNGQCKLSYETIPGLICAAEHYDLPDLLHACFHHANTHMRLNAAPKMMNALYQSSCFYITAMQLLDSIYEYIDPHGTEFFSRGEYLDLYESVFTTLLTRKTLQISELKKFQAMHGWAKEQVLRKKQRKQQLQRKSSSTDYDKTCIETDAPVQAAPSAATSTAIATSISSSATATMQHSVVPAESLELVEDDETEAEYRNLMNRLNKEINIKLDKITNEDLVKVVLPTKVFSNDKIFEVMSDESRIDY